MPDPGGGPLHFAMLTTFYPPHSFGGDAVIIRRTARALAARGHRVSVVYSSDGFRTLSGKEWSPQADSLPVDRLVKRHDLSAKPAWLGPLVAQQAGFPGPIAGRLRKLLAGGGFDVVHFHNISLLGPRVLTYDAGGAARLWTMYDHWAVCPMHVLYRYNREPCDRRDCARCSLVFHRPPQLWRGSSLLAECAFHVDACVALSAFSASKHRELGFPVPLRVLEPFVALDEVSSAPEAVRLHPRPYFLFAGRLEPIKGADALVRAVRDFGGAADVLIAGDGGEAASLQVLARGLPGVRFLGHVGAADLDALYRHAIAVVIPSAGYETFGVVAIEAFARGTPVIVRDLGPLPEIARGGRGLIFGTERELAAAMELLARSPERRAALGAQARADFLARWTDAAFMDRYFALLEPILARRARENGMRTSGRVDGAPDAFPHLDADEVAHPGEGTGFPAR